MLDAERALEELTSSHPIIVTIIDSELKDILVPKLSASELEDRNYIVLEEGNPYTNEEVLDFIEIATTEADYVSIPYTILFNHNDMIKRDF